MKKILIVLLSILFVVTIYCEEYNSYIPELITKFNFGDEIDDFTYNQNPPPTETEGIYAFAFDEKGYLYITDSWAQRILVFNNQLKFIKEIRLKDDKFYPNQFKIIQNRIEAHIRARALAVYDLLTGELLIDIGMGKNKEGLSIANNSFLYFTDSVFFWLRNGNINMIEKPVNNKKKNRELTQNSLETKEIIKKKPDLHIDDNNRLFLNKELITRNFDVWYSYWDDIHKKNKETGPILNFTKKASDYLNFYNSPDFLETDQKRNFYWSIGNGFLLVFNSNKWLIDMFLIDLEIEIYKVRPVVHPSGDIYFMDYDSKEIQLYRIKNTWAPFPWNPPAEEPVTQITYGTLTANGVRVRKEPNLRAKSLGFMGKDNRVEILDQTAKAMKIGEMESVWYKVRRLSDGLEGWVYGWFVKIGAP